jgi:putative ABC transport system permease protein
VLGGALAGVITALVFGTYATMRAAGVRPALLLRHGGLPPSAHSRWTLALGAGVAALVFGALSSAIMGSVARGMGVIGVGALALVALATVFAGLLVAVLKLPIPGAMLNVARRNLEHRRLRAIVAVIALFVGSFTVGFAASATLTARERYTAKRGSDEGVNVRIFAPAKQESQVRRALQGRADRSALALTTDIKTTNTAGNALFFSAIEGHFDTRELRIARGARVTSVNAVYLPDRFPGPAVRPGDTIIVRAEARETRLIVAGFYTPSQEQWTFSGQPLVAAAIETVRNIGGAHASIVATAALPVAELDGTIARLSRELPYAMVLSKGDFNDLVVRAYTSLFMFVAGMAGLAFLAGVVLIANAVGLALVERKREVGILKAIGYTRRHVLTTILIENAILGALAGAAGVAAVRLVAALTNQRFLQARMQVGAANALGLLVFTISLALLTAALVAWGPTRLRPLSVLRQE